LKFGPEPEIFKKMLQFLTCGEGENMMKNGNIFLNISSSRPNFKNSFVISIKTERGVPYKI
jgi:hypothetical protein